MAAPTRSDGPRPGPREAIVDRMLAAVDDLVGGGEPFAGVSVERLIRSAGVSRATFYTYFDSKDALLRTLGERVSDDLILAASAWWAGTAPVTRDGLVTSSRAIFGAYLPHHPVIASIVEGAGRDPAVRAQLEALLAAEAAVVRRHIVEGRRAGIVREGLDPDATAEWLTRMAIRGLRDLVAAASAEEREELLEALVDVLWRTLYAGVPAR